MRPPVCSLKPAFDCLVLCVFQAESGTIESLLAIDPVRIKHRLKYEHKQLSGRTEPQDALTNKERRQLLISEQAEINKEITDIKRIFSK